MIVFAILVFIGLVLLCVAVWKTLRDPDHRIPPVNTYVRANGRWRVCRTCKNMMERRWRQRQAAA